MEKPANSFHSRPSHGLNIEPTAAAHDWAGVAHLTRYWAARGMAKSLANGKPVIWDLGCGCGYGSRILVTPDTGYYPAVVAVDADIRAVDAARSDYGKVPALSIVQQNLDWSWTTEPRIADWAALDAFPRPDMIVAFELFEALRHRELFLDECQTRLQAGGLLVLNASVCDRTSTLLNPPNASIRYDPITLGRILGRYFPLVTFIKDDKVNKRSVYAELFQAVSSQFDTSFGDDVIVCRKN